jgi:hypothetical protein
MLREIGLRASKENNNMNPYNLVRDKYGLITKTLFLKR